MNTEALVVDGLQAGYGRVQVVFDVSFVLEPGEMVAMVGRNGAGKTTSLSAIAGLKYGPGGGTVSIAGKDVSAATPNEIVQSGVKMVPEGRRLFREMSVLENLRLGAFTRRRRDRAQLNDDLARVFELFPALARDRHRTVLSLSGGQQQMVAVGQALMTKPKFLLLDEPMSGLAPALIDSMYDTFLELISQGIGMLIVDQNIERVLETSSRFYVVDSGRVVLEGGAEAGALENVTKIVLGSDRQREATLDQV
jgi:branched-chain amino acid transport system ATP-binding protein